MASKAPVPKGWALQRLCDVATVILSNVDKKLSGEEAPVRLCNYTDVYYNRYIDASLPLSTGSASAREIQRFQIRAGDVLITKDSEDRHDIAVPALVVADLPHVLCGYHLAIIRPRDSALNGAFLAALLRGHRTRHYFSRLANGVTRFGLSSESIEHAKFALPPISEQMRIGAIARTYDDAIRHREGLLAKKRVFKRALMQRLLTGKRRFPGCASEYTTSQLGDFLRPVLREVPRPNEPYRRLGLRSHGKGTFVRLVDNPEDVMMESLYEVERDDLIVNITFAWEGAIALASGTEEGALVSHRFPTFVFDRNIVLPQFFRYVILTKRFVFDLGSISPGGAGRNRVMSKKEFLKLSIRIPPLQEQERIAAVLDAADREIALLRRELDLLRKQKRGLMQKLLTGQIRVKV